MQIEKIDLAEAIPVIREVISAGGVFRIYPHGISMLPTIREVRDTVCLSSPNDIVRGDIVLFVRTNGSVVLHRVVKVNKNGYDICGDNQFVPEKNIGTESIVAVVSEYTNGEKTIKRGDRTFKKQYLTVSVMRPFKRVYRHILRHIGR